MADYSDLPELIGKLKLAAIDAYMVHRGFIISGDGEHYARVGTPIPGVVSVPETVTVTCPNEAGQGGGVTTQGSSSRSSLSYVDNFAEIRARIDDALKGWTDLPDPDDIKAAQLKAEEVCGALPGGTGSNSLGRSPIDGWLTGMAENLDAMSGHVVEDFKTKFLTQLGVAMMGQHDIAVVWAATLAAEKGAFEAARASVVDAIQQATAACEKAAIQSYGDIKMALRVADWALKAVSSFTSAGAAAIFALTGLGLEVVKTFAEEIEQLDEEVYVYEEAMVAFEKALAQVNAELIEVEEQVRENLLYNLEAIRSRKGAFDLTIERTENNGSQDLQVERGLVNEITNSYMPMIADELKGIAYRIPGVSMKMAVLRDGHIGIGEQGPSGPFGEMRILLEELVRDLSWDVENGAEDLKLAVQAIVDQDATAQRKWDELDTFLAQGSGIDPWNDEHERDTRERP